MKNAYPIVITKGNEKFIVYVPDFHINTEGNDVAEAMEMARDAIGLMGIDMQDDHEELPNPSEMSSVKSDDGFVTLVDVDFDEYRRKNDMRSVKKNCTIPSWLNYAAEQANVNFSLVLQEALKQKLGIDYDSIQHA